MFFLRYWKWGVLFFLSIGGFYFLNHLKDGFWSFSIQKELPSFLESSNDEIEKHKHLLNQPFFYIGKGSQCYVFESYDKKYVLKLFKNRHIQDPYLLKQLNFLPFAQKFIKKKTIKRSNRRESLALSLALAQKHLKHESALILIQLTPGQSSFKEPLNLFDKIGWQYWVDLNKTAFLLQRRATPLPDLLPKLVAAQDQKAIQSLVQSIKEMLHQCIHVGVVDTDSDQLFVRNTAYLEDESRVIIMDVGELSNTAHLQNFQPELYINTRIQTIHDWSQNYLPELLPYLP